MAEKSEISTKQKIWEMVEAVEHTDRPGKIYDAFDYFILTLISLNVIAVIIETVDWMYFQHGVYFFWFEVFSVAVFSVEYILRVWSSQSQPKYETPFWGRIKFMLTPMAIVDLLAILPFFLTFIAFDLRFIRTIRLFRLFRVFKFARYSDTLKLFGNVIRGKKEELVVTATIMFVLVILTSSFIYLAENEAQPDKFSDIPSSMWWAIVTLTTVGYGDVFPITPLGKVFAAVIAILGVGMVALPTGILGASFVEEIDKMKAKEKSCCPHCGKDI